jgi:hypothetical protein
MHCAVGRHPAMRLGARKVVIRDRWRWICRDCRALVSLQSSFNEWCRSNPGASAAEIARAEASFAGGAHRMSIVLSEPDIAASVQDGERPFLERWGEFERRLRQWDDDNPGRWPFEKATFRARLMQELGL